MSTPMSEPSTRPDNTQSAQPREVAEEPEARTSLLPPGFRESGKADINAVEIAINDRKLDQAERERLRERKQLREEQRNIRLRNERRIHVLGLAGSYSALAVAVLAPILIGGVHLVSLLPLSLVGLAGFVSIFFWARLQGRSMIVDATGWVLIGLAGFAFLRAIPLPIGLVEFLTPAVGAWIVEAWGSSTSDPTTATLGLRPAFAYRQALMFLGAAAVYVGAINVLSSKEQMIRVVFVLGGLGLVLVILGVLQAATGNARLFFYVPGDLATDARFSSAFVNPNHLAVLLGMLSFVTLGASFGSDFREYRTGLVFLTLASAVGVVATISAPSLFAWAAALVVFALFALRPRFGSGRGGAMLAMGASAVVVVAGVGVWWSIGDLFERLAAIQRVGWLSPGQLSGPAWDLIGDSPLLGIGPGSFSDAYLATVAEPEGRFAFVSDGLLQLVLDYGFIVAAVVLAALAWTIFRVARRYSWKPKDVTVMAGFLAAFAFLAIEATSSFSLQIPGVVLPAALLLGVARGRDLRYAEIKRIHKGERAERRWPKLAPYFRIAPVVAVVVLVLLALPGLVLAFTGESGRAVETLKNAASAKEPQPEVFDAALDDALATRPVSGTLHLAAALGHHRLGRPELAQEALTRAKHFDRANPAPHLLEGRAALEVGRRDEAIAAYGRALELSSLTTGTGAEVITREIARRFDRPEGIANSLPDIGFIWKTLFSELLALGKPSMVVEIARDLLVQYPESPFRPLAVSFEAAGHEALGDIESARRIAEEQVARGTPTVITHHVLSRVALASGNTHTAYQHLEDGLALKPGHEELTFLAAEVLLEHPEIIADGESRWDRAMKKHIRVLRGLSIRHDGQRYRFYLLSGRYKAKSGNAPGAIQDLERAVKANPDSPTPLLHLAELYRAERNEREMLRVYNLLLERFPEHPQADIFRAEIRRLDSEMDDLRKRFDIPR